MQSSTSNIVGGGQYDYPVSKVVSDIAVQDISGISDLLADIYSDTTILISDLKVVDTVADDIFSDTVTIKSDLVVIDTNTKSKTHIFHL